MSPSHLQGSIDRSIGSTVGGPLESDPPAMAAAEQPPERQGDQPSDQESLSTKLCDGQQRAALAQSRRALPSPCSSCAHATSVRSHTLAQSMQAIGGAAVRPT